MYIGVDIVGGSNSNGRLEWNGRVVSYLFFLFLTILTDLLWINTATQKKEEGGKRPTY